MLYLYLMLSLSLLNNKPCRPRLGRKPSARRLFNLLLVGFTAFFVMAVLFVDNKDLQTDAANDPVTTVNTAHGKVDNSEPQEQEEPQVEPQNKLRKNNKFKVQVVSYDQIRQNKLQTRLAKLQQRQQEIEKSQESSQIISQEQESSTYLSVVERKIELSGNRRWLASGKRLVGEAEILIEIAHSGDIKNLELITSSGDEVVDNELLASVHEAAPFDKIPILLRQPGTTSMEMIRWLSFVIEENRKK